jgi:hypothetical protein
MSVIWSGVTQEGAVVPVQVTAEGKVIAVGDGPEGEFLKLTGGNLTGDLTVNDQIRLATDGSITAGDVITLGNVLIGGTLNANGSSEFAGHVTASTFVGGDSYPDSVSLAANVSNRLGGGFVKLTGRDTPEETPGTLNSSVVIDAGKTTGNSDGCIHLKTGSSNTSHERLIVNSIGNVLIGGPLPSTPNISLNATGSAEFSGDVVIGSRGEKWLIRESNGVAMLVQQTLLKQPRIEKLRDLPHELDLVQAALSEVMEKLGLPPLE